MRKDRPVVAKNLRRQGKVLVADFPHAVWDYKLGNRSAGEWVLDQHADYRPKDKTVAEKFHSYRLADHVDEVVELLKKVTRESVGLLGNLGGMR
ncbi:MAG: type ISP restriction/modification enzyme [Spirochaetota bacterium]